MPAGRAGRLLFGLLLVLVAAGPGAVGSDRRPAAAVAAPVPAHIPMPPRAPAGRAAAGGLPGPQLTVLQLNLCNSGMAGCYQGGRAVPEAATVVGQTHPDVVTLDEICRHDLTVLAAAMRLAFPRDVVSAQFQPVHQRDDAISSCVDGDQYGIGIVVHLPAGSPGVVARGGEYPDQEGRRGERRVWECLYVIGTRYVCATHLSAFNRDRALAQCRYLMTTAIPAVRAEFGGDLPIVLGGDLNLTDQGSPNTADCVPAGWLRAGDGGVQHVLVTGDHTVVSVGRLGLRYTDHPGLLVTLQPVRPAR